MLTQEGQTPRQDGLQRWMTGCLATTGCDFTRVMLQEWQQGHELQGWGQARDKAGRKSRPPHHGCPPVPHPRGPHTPSDLRLAWDGAAVRAEPVPGIAISSTQILLASHCGGYSSASLSPSFPAESTGELRAGPIGLVALRFSMKQSISVCGRQGPASWIPLGSKLWGCGWPPGSPCVLRPGWEGFLLPQPCPSLH